MREAPPRSYRSKLEVLRDFLRAAQEPAPKTRIIGAANLNPVSFTRYLRVCTERDLIMSVSGGYVATPRATPLLEAIDLLMLKRDELERAYRVLERNALAGPAPPPSEGSPFRHVLREAWNEIALRSSPAPAGRRRPALVATGDKNASDPVPRNGPEWPRGQSRVLALPSSARHSPSSRPGDDERRPSSARGLRSRR